VAGAGRRTAGPVRDRLPGARPEQRGVRVQRVAEGGPLEVRRRLVPAPEGQV
jgi:hypothetical protein